MEKVPNFIEHSQFAWSSELITNWLMYKNEIEYLIKEKPTFIPYFNTALGDVTSSWSTISLKTWDINVPKTLSNTPGLAKFLLRFPEVTSMAISRLGPNSTIKRHQGDTNAIFRCHVGISIPSSLPDCGFQVNEEQKSWEEGKLIAFVDANEHEAWNKTNQERLILMFDVIRPEFIPYKRKVCINVRAFLLTQVFVLKYPILLKLPKALIHLIFLKIKLLVYVLLPFQRKFGVIRKHS